MNNYIATLLLIYMVIAVIGYAHIESKKYIYMTDVIEYNERH